MIPRNLKTSRCHCAALSLPVMGKEEMRRVPKLPGSLADELADLPRVPVDGHEMYSAGAGEVDQAYVGTVYQAASGQWAYMIETPEAPYCGGAGFDDELEAAEEMRSRLALLNNENQRGEQE
jgi:hypothetical protein